MHAPAELHIVIREGDSSPLPAFTNRTVAEAKAVLNNHDYPVIGPWIVVTYVPAAGQADLAALFQAARDGAPA